MARGRLRPSDEKPVTSCWLQQRPGPVSDRIWHGILTTIGALVDEYAVGTQVDTSKLLAVGADGKLRLQVIWQGDIGESGQKPSCVLMNPVLGRSPASISEVPFGEPVHTVFSIDFVRDLRAGTRTIVASLFALMKV
ncbi:hypothetical protein GSI_08851 [Ganoderma sinense ZZ0214-1]|uniref:Uncharacterized protein n=1 Tax=Ganoderma sinense ZZ0214-1 TaxID=1077348 RepID=A0A2G8S502_9APHY|nr:hypothetical protein GSI_08851 [Ganoderma sinense ZZ0214-1]